MSCVQLLPLCSVPQVVTRTGLTGPTAYLNGLGLGAGAKGTGIWFASGATFSNPSSKLPQDNSRLSTGTWKPDTFRKGGGQRNTACLAKPIS